VRKLVAMSFKKLAAGTIWLGLGFLVVGMSLLAGQKAALWNNIGYSKVLAYELTSADTNEVDRGVMDKLPETEGKPGEVRYPFQMVSDWIWWRLGGSELERGRRLLHLADERLKVGWELYEQGRLGVAVETLMKAEGYLANAIDSEDINTNLGWRSEVENSAQMHYDLLTELEEVVPDEIRPRLTELLNVPQLVAVKESSQ